MKTGTIRDLLVHYQGTAPGFDVLRLALSLIIMLWHACYVCYGREQAFALVSSYPLIAPVLQSVLPMFFFLGGFLVTGSALRLRSTKTFLIFRAFRIVPALLVEVTLSAVMLGAAATTLPLFDYYTRPQFWRYFLNILGLVRFHLPGVFKTHPSSIVNVNLWTLPPDFEGYAIMAVLLLTGIIFNRKVFACVFALATFFLLLFLPVSMGWGAGAAPFVHPKLFIYSFFLGALSYLYGDQVTIRKSFMGLALLGLIFFEWKYTVFLGVLCACYLALCFGFMDWRKMPLVKRGDY